MSDGSPIPAGTESAAELGIKDLLHPKYGSYEAGTLTAEVA
jgi:hypothetical protein